MSTTAYCCYNLTNFTKPLVEHQSGSGIYIAKIISFVFGIFSLMLPNYNYAVENLLWFIVGIYLKIGLINMVFSKRKAVCEYAPYVLGGLLCIMTLFSYDLHTALDCFNKQVFDLTKLTYSQESIDRMFYILYCVLFQVYVMCLMRMFNSSRLLKRRALEVEEIKRRRQFKRLQKKIRSHSVEETLKRDNEKNEEKLKRDKEKIEKRQKFIAERKMEWELPVLIKLGKLIQKMSLKISGKYTHIVGKCSCHIQYLEERWLTYPFQPNGVDCVDCCFDKTIHMISQDMDQRYCKEWDIILKEFGFRRKLNRRPPLLIGTTCVLLSSNFSAAQSKKEYDYSIKHQHDNFSEIAEAVFPNNNEKGGLTLTFTDLEPLDDNEMKKCSSSKDNKKDYDSSSGSEGSDGSDDGRGESKGRHGNAGGGGAAGDGDRNKGTKTSSFTPGNNLERSNTNLNQFRLSGQLAKMNKKNISQCESNESIQQEEHWMEIIQQEDSLLSPNDHVTKMHSLGMTIEALVEFAYAHDCWELPTWKVVDDIIKPATKKTRCRYGDLPELKECFGPAAVYMSHCWGAKFGDLIGAACHGASKDRIVWIDIFAVRQWPGNVADKRDLNFLNLISKCETLVVSTSPVAGLKTFMTDPQERDAFLASLEGQVAKKLIPFLRLWCITEIVAAIKLYVPIVVKCGSVLNTNGSWKYDTLCAGELMKNIQHTP